MYIWQRSDWPHFRYDSKTLGPLLKQVRLLQGKLTGHAEHLNHQGALETQMNTLVQEALQTSAIEGETLNVSSVRSSAARRLGLDNSGVEPGTEETDQLVAMLADAVANVDTPLTQQTLFDWQVSLFPTRPLFMPKEAIIGGLREDDPGHPMVVDTRKGSREIIHFEAPPSDLLPHEVGAFLHWFNHESQDIDGLLRAGLAHLWLVTLHPFSDGNGRVTRAVADRALAQDEHNSVRFYSMSAAIVCHRSSYYDALESTQKGSLEVTAWLQWFLGTLAEAVQRSIAQFQRTLDKARFWQVFQDAGLNDRQRKVINRLFDAAPDEFEHGINAGKYKSIASTSKATATRDLAALVELGCLVQRPGGGRSTRYDLNLDLDLTGVK